MKTVGSNCENCGNPHDQEYGSGRFCSSICARGFSTKSKRADINQKVSRKLTGKPTGRVITEEQQLLLRRGQAEYYAAVPFDELKLSGKRSRVFAEQHHKCNVCGLDEWRGRPLVLELEHKDGNNLNNDRSNLEGLCPNCHSLTPTWRGRNKGNSKNISDEEFKAALSETPSIHQALLKLGLTPKGGNYKRAKRLL